MNSYVTDLEIAQNTKIKNIKEIASKIGISEEQLEQYGNYKAKLPLSLIDQEKIKQHNLILVTAMTPTPAGEGKTTVSIGLTEGLNKIGKQATVVLREPSLGPIFGIKGGATGGGYSQVIPMEDINLHFTGDFSAIEKANNLLSALIDNNLQSKTRNLDIDPRTITWKRVMDMNDRSLREIIIGLGGTTNGVPRQDGFNITPASEIMAILCLANDMEDLKKKLGNILIGFTYGKKPIYARDLNAVGAMAMLLKDAIKPNLVQTIEGNPAILHGGPFANIAQGTNSIIATKMALSHSEYVVTEAGFGSDLGAEKFLNIKCQYGNLSPKTIVIVATIRALRFHGGADIKQINEVNIKAVEQGFTNLEKHIENAKMYNITPIVAINKFMTDSSEEIMLIQNLTSKLNIKAIISDGWAKGGAGTIDLATEVSQIADNKADSVTSLYDWNESIENKILEISTKTYGATSVEYLPAATEKIKNLHKLGLNTLPICMAKTQKSFSDDEKKIGRPKNFSITVRDIEIAAGAGFIIPITGKMMRMPGLPATPSAEQMDIDNRGNIIGLS